ASQPILHPPNLGLEVVVWRMSHQGHPIQVDQGKDRENLRLVEVIAGKGGNLTQVSPEIHAVQANAGQTVKRPLPGDEKTDGPLLRLTFAQDHDAAAPLDSGSHYGRPPISPASQSSARLKSLSHFSRCSADSCSSLLSPFSFSATITCSGFILATMCGE